MEDLLAIGAHHMVTLTQESMQSPKKYSVLRLSYGTMSAHGPHLIAPIELIIDIPLPTALQTGPLVYPVEPLLKRFNRIFKSGCQVSKLLVPSAAPWLKAPV